MNGKDQEECKGLLKNGVMFKHCSDESLSAVCKEMGKKEFPKGTKLIEQGENTSKMFLIASGTVERLREVDGQLHNVDTAKCGTTVSSLHLLKQEPCYATALADTDVVAYYLTSEKLNTIFDTNPKVAKEVLYGLTREVRSNTKQMKTPLLQQHGKQYSYAVISVAASIESFYRSALNSILNSRLTGAKASLFPNMHIQMPTRVLYINGIKGFRNYLDTSVNPLDYQNPTLARLAIAISPGLIMTPVSSVLEACNAGHANPEALYTRIFRGIVPRAAREVIFGIGLNQLSDFCEERFINILDNKTLSNAAGSMTAGVISGYLSHIPHNLSSLKLMNPHKSYSQHFNDLIQRTVPEQYKRPGTFGLITSIIYTCVFPKGVTIRTSQIVGSFIILNGIINAFKDLNFGFLQRELKNRGLD